MLFDREPNLLFSHLRLWKPSSEVVLGLTISPIEAT